MPITDPVRKKADRQRRINRNKQIVKELKSNPCVDCRIELPWQCMDFDHIDPSERLFWVSNGNWDTSEARLRNEIAKCELRCPNCHRLRHFHDDEYNNGSGGRDRA